MKRVCIAVALLCVVSCKSNPTQPSSSTNPGITTIELRSVSVRQGESAIIQPTGSTYQLPARGASYYVDVEYAHPKICDRNIETHLRVQAPLDLSASRNCPLDRPGGSAESCTMLRGACQDAFYQAGATRDYYGGFLVAHGGRFPPPGTYEITARVRELNSSGAVLNELSRTIRVEIP